MADRPETIADAEAWARANEDARMFGSGFVMITPNGVHYLPAEAVSIDRDKVLEIARLHLVIRIAREELSDNDAAGAFLTLKHSGVAP